MTRNQEDFLIWSKKAGRALWDAGMLFNQKSGTTLASSSTFYILTTIVPTLLLLVRGIGAILGDIHKVERYLFILGREFFPSVAPELLENLKTFITGPLFAGRELTMINFFLLGISAISFLNSIWNGIYIISEDKSFMSLWKYVRGLAVIGITIVGLITLLYLPRFIVMLIKFVQTNFLIDFLYAYFEILRHPINIIKALELKKSFFFVASIVNFLGMITYFTWLYRWFFSNKISWREGFLASVTFTGALYLGKSFFWIYSAFVKKGLEQNYGELYTFVIGIMWLFFLMCFFYYGACICNVFIKNRERRKIKAVY